MIGAFWPETDARPVIQPQPPLFRLLLRYFKPFMPSDPLHTLMVQKLVNDSQYGRQIGCLGENGGRQNSKRQIFPDISSEEIAARISALAEVLGERIRPNFRQCGDGQFHIFR